MESEGTIQAWARKRGYRNAVGSVTHLEEVRRSLQRHRESGEIDPGFYRENLDAFTYLDGVPLTNPRSVIIVAVPAPAYILTFVVGSKTVEAILPPTYLNYRKKFVEVRDDLAKALAEFGYRVELLNAPLKALGNRLGLLCYGRNNVGYIEGLGSYFQLVGLVSDMPIDIEALPSMPGEKLLPRCGKCRICAAACPTGAIGGDRILLHAEKCYTLFSESIRPIPESLKPPSPKCLIGCLRCQELCPEDKGLLRQERAPVSFDAEETAAFLGLKPAADGPAFERALAKFRELGLTEGLRLFRRNLAQLLRIHGLLPPDSVSGS
jgi:epoxyqueuosine reductase